MYKTILVPVDGSDTSTLGLQEAIKIAQSDGCRLCLLHVINDVILDYSYGAKSFGLSLIDSQREAGKAILQRAGDLVRQQSIPVESVMLERVGVPAADSIVAQAIESRADLIVMGTHGRRGLRRLTMGSDAEAVVRESSIPVLLVSPKSRSEAAGKAPSCTASAA